MVTSVVAGCGNDGSAEALAAPTEYATCDRRSSDHTCLEISAAMKWLDNESKTVVDERDVCLDVWTAGSHDCPDDADLIGCCAYETNRGRYRECFYTGADDPMTYCENQVHGYWQPSGF
jgi:hypothetical protein